MLKSTGRDATEVSDRDKNVIRYATQATIKNDGLSQVDLPRLVQANRELHKTREAIPHSGNKLADIVSTQGESSIRNELRAEYTGHDGLSFTNQYLKLDFGKESGLYAQADIDENKRDIIKRENTNRAANATAAGAGNCAHTAYVATRNLAGKFDTDANDTICTVMSKIPGVDHAWTTLDSSDGLGKSPLIVDGWMAGPVVRANDARNLHQGTTQELEKYNNNLEKTELANDYNKEVDRFKNTKGSGFTGAAKTRAEEISDFTAIHMKSGLGKKKADLAQLNPTSYYDKTYILSPQFRAESRAAAIQLQTPSQLQGPINSGELYVAPIDTVGSTKEDSTKEQVNNMISELSKEIGVHKSVVAAEVAEVIRVEAAMSPLDETIPSWADKTG